MVYTWHDYRFVSHIAKNDGMTGLYKQKSISKELTLTW